jgi:hypothetical protein
VKVSEARDLVLSLMMGAGDAGSMLVDPHSPDLRDSSKFLLRGEVARPIHHFNGWNVNIHPSWFSGGLERPEINGSSFYWYVFALPATVTRLRRDHYFICDYLQMRQWVLEFAAPLGRDHRDHFTWRCDFRFFKELGLEDTAYFRWGDEPTTETPLGSRVIALDNGATLAEPAPRDLRIGQFGRGGESADHKLLKLYVAKHPTEFGLSSDAKPNVEYGFVTGDRVDVMFENHHPERTVVEIEVEGDRNVCVGIHQAVKYRSLMEVEFGQPLLSPRVQSLVVAYNVDYPGARELSDRYGVPLRSVSRAHVMAS